MFFEAVFRPKGNKDYIEEAASLIGKRIALQEGWVLTEGDFTGEQCYLLANSTIGWIPESDLDDIKPVSYARWDAIQKSLGLGQGNG